MNSTSMTIPLINRSRQTAESVRGSSSCCERCGGLMIGERCMDIGESLGGYWFWAMRCIQCGDPAKPTPAAGKAAGSGTSGVRIKTERAGR